MFRLEIISLLGEWTEFVKAQFQVTRRWGDGQAYFGLELISS